VIDVLKQVVAAAYASLGTAGIVLGAEGNASVAERSSHVALVTGTGLHAREATADGIAEVGLHDGAHRSGPAPTSELPSHLALLRAGHGAVIHTHAPHATALGLVLDEVPLVMAEQAARAGAAAPVVPYATPGSDEMALSLAAALRGPVRAVVIRNHGLFTVGPDIISALSATLATEEAARVYLLARGVGEPALVPGHAIATLRALGGITA
jgi:ribulose-5-phosphate 4-epimerase/fuculose-1-phosphate aldolase